MKKRLSLCSLLLLISLTLTAQYLPDTFGGNYQYRTIQMPDDYEGKVVCTLIKKDTLPDAGKAILYVHGYNDYFFQKGLGDSLAMHGYRFYALDLRKYGRSFLPHQDAFFCKNLNEYFADLDTALSIMRGEGNDSIYLMAHSTGGLITPLYVNSRKASAPVRGLLLNSPFLDMNMSWFMEKVLMPVVAFVGKFFPRWEVQGGGSVSIYAKTLLKTEKGEWEFNTAWKKPLSHPKRAGWLRAIYQGHREVRKKCRLSCPVLVMSSDKSGVESEEWSDEFLKEDLVLDVKDIQKYGARLGDHVTLQIIPDGIHDLILSPRPARDKAYATIFDWLEKNESIDK